MLPNNSFKADGSAAAQLSVGLNKGKFMAELEAEGSYRSEVALRMRRRALDDRLRRFTAGVFGLMGYSAVSNFLATLGSFSGATEHQTFALFSVAFGLLLGALYSFGAYRVWFKDDIRWWPVAFPAGISIVLSLLAFVAGALALVPLVINVALLVMVPIRKRAAAAAAAIASKPLSVSPLFKE
jgi:hypothetical protein